MNIPSWPKIELFIQIIRNYPELRVNQVVQPIRHYCEHEVDAGHWETVGHEMKHARRVQGVVGIHVKLTQFTLVDQLENEEVPVNLLKHRQDNCEDYYERLQQLVIVQEDLNVHFRVELVFS